MSRASEEGSSSTVLDKVRMINNESDLTQMKEVSALLALSYPLYLPYMDRYLNPERVFAKSLYQFY